MLRLEGEKLRKPHMFCLEREKSDREEASFSTNGQVCKTK